MDRIEAEGPEAVHAENERLREERDKLLEQTRFFAAHLLNEVLGANRRTAPQIKPRLDAIAHEIRKHIRSAYLRRLHLLMLLDDETIAEGVGHALLLLLREEERQEASAR